MPSEDQQRQFRSWSEGRLGADDDGDIKCAIASDPKRGKIIIRFPHAVEWIGMGREQAETLVEQLEKHILRLRGITD